MINNFTICLFIPEVITILASAPAYVARSNEYNVLFKIFVVVVSAESCKTNSCAIVPVVDKESAVIESVTITALFTVSYPSMTRSPVIVSPSTFTYSKSASDSVKPVSIVPVVYPTTCPNSSKLSERTA